MWDANSLYGLPLLSPSSSKMAKRVRPCWRKKAFRCIHLRPFESNRGGPIDVRNSGLVAPTLMSHAWPLGRSFNFIVLWCDSILWRVLQVPLQRGLNLLPPLTIPSKRSWLSKPNLFCNRRFEDVSGYPQSLGTCTTHSFWPSIRGGARVGSPKISKGCNDSSIQYPHVGSGFSRLSQNVKLSQWWIGMVGVNMTWCLGFKGFCGQGKANLTTGKKKGQKPLFSFVTWASTSNKNPLTFIADPVQGSGSWGFCNANYLARIESFLINLPWRVNKIQVMGGSKVPSPLLS